MSTIEIIPYDPSLKEELVEFRSNSYETAFPESRDYLEWKYERNPYLPEPVYYLARAEGRIVGLRGMYGTRWEFGAERETVLLPCADDFAVAPAYRNRGVMNLIMREAIPDLVQRGYDYVINTSGGRLTATTSLASGWKAATPLEPVVRRSARKRIQYAVRQRIRGMRGGWRVIRDAKPIVSSPKPYRRIDEMGTVRTSDGAVITAEREPRAQAMADFIARLPFDGRIRHVRDAAFYRWRYQSPIRQYRFFYYERGGQLDGYLALGSSVEFLPPRSPFNVVDWEGADQGVREALLRHVIRVTGIEELGAFAANLSGVDRALLEREGFVPTDFESRSRGLPCVLVKKLGATAPVPWTLGGSDIVDRNRWDMRLIYTMTG